MMKIFSQGFSRFVQSQFPIDGKIQGYLLDKHGEK